MAASESRRAVAKSITLALALCIGGAAQAQDAAIFKRAKAQASKGLFDPYSVKFEDLRVIKKDKGTAYVCGTFNAKNRFGAYVGLQPFLYVEDKESYAVKPGDSLEGLLTAICG